MNKSRITRKKEHLILALQGSRCSFVNLYSDIVLPHDCLTEVSPAEVDLSTSLCGYSLPNPLFINAITGGALLAESINRRLAILAARYKLPMAVGSQSAGIYSRSLQFTYQVVRKYNKDGLIMANLSAYATPKQALAAVKMLEAQVLQLHVNAAQELIMPEGSWPGQGLLKNIEEICASISVPVIVKEVGFGMGAAQGEMLAKAGVRCVDVSGTGGTNFAIIEGKRNKSSWWRPFRDWGLPTPVCVAEVTAKVPGLEVLASGGVNDGVKALKCLALGATAVGIAGVLLKELFRGDLKGADQYVHDYLVQMKTGMALMGVRTHRELKTIPLVITGRLKDFILQRKMNP